MQHMLALESVNRAVNYTSKQLLNNLNNSSTCNATTATSTSTSTSTPAPSSANLPLPPSTSSSTANANIVNVESSGSGNLPSRASSGSSNSAARSALPASSASAAEAEAEEARRRKLEEQQRYESFLPAILSFGRDRAFRVYNPNLTLTDPPIGGWMRRDEDRLSAEAATLLALRTTCVGCPTLTSGGGGGGGSCPCGEALAARTEDLQQMQAASHHPPIYDAVRIRYQPIYHHIVTCPPAP